MIHNIYLKRGRDIPDLLVGTAETPREANEIYMAEVRRRGIHSEPYTRFWNRDGSTIIDFGSHTFFVKITPQFEIFEMLGEIKE
jgi:hypothetical protein